MPNLRERRLSINQYPRQQGRVKTINLANNFPDPVVVILLLAAVNLIMSSKINWIKFDPKNPPEENKYWLVCEQSKSEFYGKVQHLLQDSFSDGKWELTPDNVSHYAELPELPTIL